MDDDLNFIKFRFTPQEELTDEAHYSCALMAFVNHITDAEYVTCGYEVLNKLGEPTKPHYHYHIATKKSIGAIRKAFQRSDYYTESNVKGNELYSLGEEKDVVDFCRFFRYVFKQGGRRKFREKLPPDFDINIEIKCAQEEYASMVKFNQAKRDKALMPTTCDKLMEYLETLEVKPMEDLDILEKMIQYYADKGSASNKQTLLGYLNTYKIRNGITTARKMAEEWLK